MKRESRSKYVPQTNTPLLEEARKEMTDAGQQPTTENKENEVSQVAVINAVNALLLIA